MKRLINPPVQSLLWLGGFALLGVAAWSLFELKMMDESKIQNADNVTVRIPDATVLDIPAVHRYPQMVRAPLFWVERKPPKPPKVEPPPPPVQQQVVTPVETTLPEGRLIGIIDLGSDTRSFAIMENAAGGSVHLRVGDFWGAWKVTGIDPDRLFLQVGDQKQNIPLIADFSSPEENPDVAQARQQRRQQAVRQQQAVAAPAAAPPPSPFESVPLPAESAAPPPLTTQEALEARQRLMASRWGGLSGESQNQNKGQAGAAPPQ